MRMHNAKEDIPSCFQTLSGTQDFRIIRSYLGPLHKREHDMFRALRSALSSSLSPSA